MKKPTRFITVTAAAIALVAAVVSISSAQATDHHSTTAQLDASRVHPSVAASSSAHPTLSAPVPPSSYSSSATAPASTLVLAPAPAPAPAPAKQDPATSVAPAPGPASSKKPVAGPAANAAGGCHASSSVDSSSIHVLDDASYPEHSDIANAVYSLINQERAANCLAALGRSGQLNSSANAHNVAMANTGQFAHQVSGEAGLGDRISATGYHWTTAGENIAWGSSASVSFAEDLETQMYNEPPNQPNHRANILSTSYHNVGVDVITDGNGKMWITCDFGS